MSPTHPHCQIVPPFLLEKVVTPEALQRDADLRRKRARTTPTPSGPAAAGAAPFVVHTANSGTDLPGELVRSAGDPATGDPAVDEAYAGVEGTLALFQEVYDRASYDGQGAQVVTTVHYDKDYDNAFWDGQQLVIGDGDGTVFERFTIAADVLGHELTHAVTQHTANLTYQGQSGALNESISDVFGSLLKQRLAGETADEADWLIGEGIFKPGIRGTALRSMKEPGTAYDDPKLGKDPQVSSMDDYVETADDNGGVHTNSGIPNKAFYLAATALGGNSWDGAGAIWYAALTSGLDPDTDFAGFAAATVAAAKDVSPEAEAAVTKAWTSVGVTPEAGSTQPPTTTTGTATRTVRVTRTGGFAGMQLSGEVALGDDPRTPEVESLLRRIDFAGVAAHQPQPDRFVFTFDVDGRQTVVGEQDLSSDLDQLARLLLPG
jgi:Thermolysin metallopeptidase, alpha-helical domain/Thermolysin metallopeptidase, catalytic domain/Emfourin